MANSQDHVWHILRDVLELLAVAGIPTPERGYALDGGWSLALSDLRRLVNDRNALRTQIKTVIAERDQLRAELAAAKEEAARFERHYIGTTKDIEKMRDQLAEATEERTALAAHVERLVGALGEVGKQLDACKTFVTGGCMGQTTDNIMKATVYHRVPYMLREFVHEALAATPAQSLAAHDADVKVAVLREVANLIRNTTPEPIEKVWSTHGSHEGRILAVDQILSEADRIAKEAL